MAIIAKITTRDTINFRGDLSLTVDVSLSDGATGYATMPFWTFHDSEKDVKAYAGSSRMHLDKAVSQVHESINNVIAPKVKGMDALDQTRVDHVIGLHTEETIVNITLGVSLAVAKAAAASLNMPVYRYIGGFNTKRVPLPMVNVLSGGRLIGNNLDFREFMIMPVGDVCFAEALRMCTQVYHSLKNILKRYERSTKVDGAGSFIPYLSANEEALAVLVSAIKNAGYTPGKQIALALNVAASDFFEGGEYNLPGEGFIKTPAEMVEYYTRLVDEYPIICIQNAIAKDDEEGWGLLCRNLGDKTQLVGYGHLAVNKKHPGQGGQSKNGNAVVIKVSQMATLSEILDNARMARNAGYTCIISHCANVTEDTVMADIAVGVSAAQVKGGLAVRTGQAAVYNQLLCIEAELGGWDRSFYI